MCHNALPVRGTLLRKGCRIDPQYPLCLDDIEATDHLFGGCPMYLSSFGTSSSTSMDSTASTNESFTWLIQSFGTMKNSCNGKILQRISFLLWSIWKAKNAVTFQNEFFNPMKCLIRANKLSVEWRSRTCLSVDNFLQESSSTPTKNYKFVRWQSPNPGRVKLNFDSSLQNNSIAEGYILRD